MMDFLRPAAVDIVGCGGDYRMEKGETGAAARVLARGSVRRKARGRKSLRRRQWPHKAIAHTRTGTGSGPQLSSVAGPSAARAQQPTLPHPAPAAISDPSLPKSSHWQWPSCRHPSRRQCPPTARRRRSSHSALSAPSTQPNCLPGLDTQYLCTALISTTESFLVTPFTSACPPCPHQFLSFCTRNCRTLHLMSIICPINHLFRLPPPKRLSSMHRPTTVCIRSLPPRSCFSTITPSYIPFNGSKSLFLFRLSSRFVSLSPILCLSPP